MLKINNLTKKYKDKIAIDDINIDITKPSIVGFVGKNGAGKSTTIKCILNYIFQDKGNSEILNLDNIKDSKLIKKHTAYMPSEINLYNNISSKELFEFCIQFSNIDKSEYLRLAKLFELDIDKKIETLSLGNKKKTAIIASLLKDVNFLIFDEPTSSLDPIIQDKFFEILKEYKSKGKIIFLSSHNLDEIQNYCDRVIFIKDGKVIEDINLKEVDIDNDNIKIVKVEYLDGTKKEYEFKGDIKELINSLKNEDILDLEIKNKSLKERFLKYY